MIFNIIEYQMINKSHPILHFCQCSSPLIVACKDRSRIR